MTLQDALRLVAPQKLIETFFNAALVPSVDQTRNPWGFRRVNRIDIGVSEAVVAQFRSAPGVQGSVFLTPGRPPIYAGEVPKTGTRRGEVVSGDRLPLSSDRRTECARARDPAPAVPRRAARARWRPSCRPRAS